MPLSKAKSGKKPSAAAQAVVSQTSQATMIRQAVPQWFRLDPDQIQGAAGGFVWQISDKEQVIRYLIIGSEGGNYYQTPQQVSSKCASCILRMTRTPDNFKWLIDTIREVSIEGRAAKQEPTLLALATAIVFAPTPSDKTEALNAVKDCVRILTHMYMLIGYIKIFSKSGHPSLAPASNVERTPQVTGSGIGRGIRRVFGEYFYSRTGIEIANLMTKYQNREGWSIKDVLTLVHIDPKKMKDDGGRLAIDYVFKSKEEFEPILAASLARAQSEPSFGGGTPAFLSAIKEIQTIVNRHPANAQYPEEINRIAQLINQVGLCREQLPSQLFKYRKVWEALLTNKGANGKGKGMPLTALIRNLGKLSTAEIGIITPTLTLTPDVRDICDRITDAAEIKRTRIHPYNILVAMLTYKKGKGDKGSLSWMPNPQILAALDKAFKLAFQNITPTGKRIKIALDVSGSMSTNFCTGSPIVSCATGSVAMMMMTLWTERRRGVGVELTTPPQAIGGTTSLPEPIDGGRTPLWKSTQLPDGRTLYENTKTNECQFSKPQEMVQSPPNGGGGGGTASTLYSKSSSPPRITLSQYKETKKYIGHPEDQARAAKESSVQYGYSSMYYTPKSKYLPELYPPPATPTNVTICAFSNTLINITNAIVGYMDATIDPVTGLPTMTIDDALNLVEMPFSNTDCALPMIRALENREEVDAFVIYTDSETYMGNIHPQAALERYRTVMGINAKLIVVGMTSNCLTIADPKDLNTLNLAGFDTATPRIINDFIAGGLLPANGSASQRQGTQNSAGGAAEAAVAAGEEEDDEFVMLDAE